LLRWEDYFVEACVARYRHAYSRETTLAKVADTFKDSIIDQHFDHYTEIIIGVHEHASAKMTIYTTETTRGD